MNLLDIASAVLVKTRQLPSLEIAKEHIISTFKTEFPYWSFTDWNAEVPMNASKIILRIYEDDQQPVIRELIIDLPALLETFKQTRPKV